MTVQYDVTPARDAGARPGDCPHPVSLETLGLLEQALADVLRSVGRSPAARAAEEAGRIEYESWRAHYR